MSDKDNDKDDDNNNNDHDNINCNNAANSNNDNINKNNIINNSKIKSEISTLIIAIVKLIQPNAYENENWIDTIMKSKSIVEFNQK